MPIEIVVPRLGWSMDEGTFVEWLKSDGDFVAAGDMLFILEGEKASQEIESFDEGILHISGDAPQPGDTVVVGQRLSYLLAEGEAPPTSSQPVAAVKPAADEELPVAKLAKSFEELRDRPNVLATSATAGVRVAASPRARRTARELGVDWAVVPGSGRNGRVRERDVIAAASMKPSQAERLPKTRGILQPPSKIRRTIAQRMLAAVQQTAPVTLTTKVDASELFATRQQYKRVGVQPLGDSYTQMSAKACTPADKSSSEEIAPSYNDILVKLVAAALPECPELNAGWINDAVYTYDEINIAIAVDTPHGLLAPVLRNVETLSLEKIAAESRRLTEQALSGNLTEEQLAGGTFTITNLGMFDIDYFTPIINLPQTAILGIGRIADEPVVSGGQVVPGKTLSLSLTFDHRVIDGAPAARWLQRLAGMIRQVREQL